METPGQVISKLRATLTGIQHGDIEDTLGIMEDVCAVADTITPSFTPEMVTAEQGGSVLQLSSDGLHGHERQLLDHVVKHAEPGNPESVRRPLRRPSVGGRSD
jgi:hypothetical protein